MRAASGGGVLDRPLDESTLFLGLRRFWRLRLTSRGRALLALAGTLGILGVDTRRALVFVLFAFAAGPLVVAASMMLRRRPRVRVAGALPAQLTAGRAVAVSIDVVAETDRPSGPLVVSWPSIGDGERGIRVVPPESFVECAPGAPGRVRLEVTAARRGRHRMPGLLVSRTDPLGLLCTGGVEQPERVVLAYPRFYTLDAFPIPVGRRYQPGGIPLASSLGDSIEFVGTRDYRRGDPLRRIHWRSWARRGKPVVKEYQEEYFSRVALVLDTFLPRRPSAPDRERLEAAISSLASLADCLSRSEEVVDVLIAGPEVYEVSAGRSLGYLDGVLRVLACIGPCHEPPFERLEPRLFERLARLTTVVAVLLDWDEPRARFFRRVRDLGVAVRVVLVNEHTPRLSFGPLADEVGGVTVLKPLDVARRLDADPAAARA